MIENNRLDYKPEIKFKKIHNDAQLPKKNHQDDTGFDLYAVEDVLIPAKGSAVVPNGLQVSYISPGYWFRIEPRSGLGFKHGLQPHLGVIDSGYRGELSVKLFNFSDVDYHVKKGDRIAQIAIYYNIDIGCSWGEVVQTERGDKRLGSSGK